jgi:uncharacterized protein with FMN-binding domain
MPTITKRLLALGFAGLGVTAALAGCAADPGTDGGDGGNGGDEETSNVDTGADTSVAYADGTYTAEGDYISPAGPSHVTVELTLEGDLVTAVTVTPLATDPTSKGFQTQFADGISAAIVGQDIDTLNVSRVGGSSLTSGGFHDALEQIKAEAVS